MEETPEELKSTTSPIIKKPVDRQNCLTFFEGLQALYDLEGVKLHCLDWVDRGYYAHIGKDGYLYLHKPDGKDYTWTITLTDMDGEDYIIL